MSGSVPASGEPGSAGSGTAPALVARDLAKGFRRGFLRRRSTVLEGVDLELGAGGSLGLLGPNGVGKSTFLRLAAGVLRADRGRVALFGHDARSAAARQRSAYLPEEGGLPAEMRARSALLLTGSLYGMDARRARERGDRLLERVGLAPQAGGRLGRFSRGMRRRFALAQAWLTDPDLLLLDEPSAGLDAEGLFALDGLLAEARGAGKTLVLCSHAPSDLARHCDEIALFWRGRVVERGPTAAVLGEEGDVAAIYRRLGLEERSG